MSLISRPLKLKDIPIICTFPQSEDELYFISPRASYPLMPLQLEEVIVNRSDPIVVELDGTVVGFANFYRWEMGGDCSIGNVIVASADHLQNFAMLHTRDGWQLSPAYDIVPNIYQSSQIIMINRKHHGIDASDLLAEGREYGLSLQKCRSLLQEVINALAVWPDVFADCGVPESHTGKLRSIIYERMQCIGK